jgi:hypothetical protein
MLSGERWFFLSHATMFPSKPTRLTTGGSATPMLVRRHFKTVASSLPRGCEARSLDLDRDGDDGLEGRRTANPHYCSPTYGHTL